MSRQIPIGQLIGGCIEYAIWFAVGAYIAWLRPRRMHDAVLSGKISEDEARQKLKNLSPFLGHAIMIVAVLMALTDFI